jgi:hypothetical protein
VLTPLDRYSDYRISFQEGSKGTFDLIAGKTRDNEGTGVDPSPCHEIKRSPADRFLQHTGNSQELQSSQDGREFLAILRL